MTRSSSGISGMPSSGSTGKSRPSSSSTPSSTDGPPDHRWPWFFSPAMVLEALVTNFVMVWLFHRVELRAERLLTRRLFGQPWVRFRNKAVRLSVSADSFCRSVLLARAGLHSQRIPRRCLQTNKTCFVLHWWLAASYSASRQCFLHLPK